MTLFNYPQTEMDEQVTNNQIILAVEPKELKQVRIEAAVQEILRDIGEDPQREGLLKTPDRVARMFEELTAGYHVDTEKLINGAIFNVDYDEMVVVKDIDFYSMCEHHMLPFYGRAHVAYIPNGKVVGLSKIPRIVEMFARRLQIQERLTSQIAGAIMDAIDAQGVGVVMECKHLCMMMRGVEKQHSVMTTSSMLGSFHTNEATRLEFLNLIGRNPGF